MDTVEPLRSYVPRQGDLIGLMMTTPALALFYGGMTRSKSVLAIPGLYAGDQRIRHPTSERTAAS